MPILVTDACEVVGRAQPGGIVYTCEHASNRVPRPWRLRPDDRRLLGTHWGYDIGAAALTRSLARRGKTVAVLSRFSRLLIDPNREPTDASAILRRTDDGSPRFNRSVDLDARVARFFGPFHEGIRRVLLTRPRLLISVHSFTPEFRGQRRAMHAGVLYDRHDELAQRLLGAMNAEGLNTADNEPYSGKDGLIYSAARHGAQSEAPYLEIEVRQDLLGSARAANRVAATIQRALVRAGL